MSTKKKIIIAAVSLLVFVLVSTAFLFLYLLPKRVQNFASVVGGDLDELSESYDELASSAGEIYPADLETVSAKDDELLQIEISKQLDSTESLRNGISDSEEALDKQSALGVWDVHGNVEDVYSEMNKSVEEYESSLSDLKKLTEFSIGLFDILDLDESARKQGVDDLRSLLDQVTAEKARLQNIEVDESNEEYKTLLLEFVDYQIAYYTEAIGLREDQLEVSSFRGQSVSEELSNVMTLRDSTTRLEELHTERSENYAEFKDNRAKYLESVGQVFAEDFAEITEKIEGLKQKLNNL